MDGASIRDSGSHFRPLRGCLCPVSLSVCVSPQWIGVWKITKPILCAWPVLWSWGTFICQGEGLRQGRLEQPQDCQVSRPIFSKGELIDGTRTQRPGWDFRTLRRCSVHLIGQSSLRGKIGTAPLEKNKKKRAESEHPYDRTDVL